LELICPKCGQINSSGSKFCNECAHDLRKPEESLPVDYSQPQSYTPKHLRDKILTTRSSIEGERKLVTVFFADVANYTSMSEKLDPEEVHQIMDGCFKILMDEIHKYEGTINQFTADGVMALFGAPVAHEDHTQRACYAALSVQKAMEEYGGKIKKDTGIDFQMRIGLNSGHVVVGSIGDDLRMDYTAIGDTTNLASRMESLAQPSTILVSKDTHRLVKDFFEFETLEKIEVKGKEDLQEAYKLIRTSEVETRFRASVAKGLTRFVGRKNSMPALMELYDKARGGSGQVVGIVMEKTQRTLQKENTTLEAILYMAFELSNEKWKIAFSNGDKKRIVTINARNLEKLQEEIEKAKVRFNIEDDVRMISCYEAGRDGFWIHRYLLSCGIENKVVDSSSLEVNRRKRRAKTDRIDAGRGSV
jgi:class 3 adenylate cyclase